LRRNVVGVGEGGRGGGGGGRVWVVEPFVLPSKNT